MAKIRVHELAKELDVSSKDMVYFLQEAGVFVRSASMMLEDETVAMVRERAAAGLGPKKPNDEAHRGTFNKGDPFRTLRASLSLLEASPEYAAGDPWAIERVEFQRAWLSNLVSSRALNAEPAAEDTSLGAADPSEGGAIIEAPGISGRYYSASSASPEEQSATADDPAGSVSSAVPEQGYVEFQRGAKGVSFEKLLVPYLLGATEITITDPYVRTLQQARNLMELLEALLRLQDGNIQTVVHLRTSKDKDGDDLKDQAQKRYLDRIVSSLEDTNFSLQYELEPGLHGRTIVANSGWRISLDRGLDIFEKVPSDPLHLANRMQEFRKVRAFFVTYHPLS